MKRATQTVYIVENSTSYAFDGVTKAEVKTSLKVAEETGDVKGKKHVNYAILQPTTVSLEVYVSDTLSAPGEPLTKGSQNRFVTAHQRLMALQQRRNPLTLVLPTCTLPNMQMESLSQSHSDECPVGTFYATLGFKQITVEQAKKTPTTGIKAGQADVEGGNLVSVLRELLGRSITPPDA